MNDFNWYLFLIFWVFFIYFEGIIIISFYFVFFELYKLVLNDKREI